MRRTFVTQESDIIKAVSKEIDTRTLKYEFFEVCAVEQIKGTLDFCEIAIVRTTHGDYFCECFEDNNHNIYTKVCRYI